MGKNKTVENVFPIRPICLNFIFLQFPIDKGPIGQDAQILSKTEFMGKYLKKRYPQYKD